MGTEKTLTASEAKAQMVALNEEAKANWSDPKWRYEAAEVITESITEGFETENLVDMMAETENLGFEGRSFVREVKGMRAFWTSRGGYIEESTIHEETFEIKRDIIGFHVSEMEEKLETSFGPTSQTLIDLGIRRTAAEINNKVLKTFQAAVGPTSPYYTAAAGLSLATLNTGLREVMDEQIDGEVVILGRRTMTDKIVDEIVNIGSGYGAFLPETNEQLLKQGVLGTYRGARIITLRNFKNDLGTSSWFPANELWVVGRNASKFAFFGGPKFKEFVEQDNWFWHYLQKREFGGVVYRPERLRRIIDTTQAP
jgi:hypothetical protein